MSDKSQSSNLREAKVFIVYHPAAISVLAPIVSFIRTDYPHVDCILIRVLHPYWKTVELDPYLSSYDAFFSLPNVEYATNVLSGLVRASQFKREVGRIARALRTQYSKIDVYSDNSAYLPVNILLSYFYRSGCANNIYRMARASHSRLSSGPRNRFRSITVVTYCLILRLFKVRAIRLPSVTDFIYADGSPVDEVILENPYASLNSEKSQQAGITLPEPYSLLNRDKTADRNIVAIFGDTGILPGYSRYIDDEEQYNRKLSLFFERIKSFYEGCTLLYKPHPSNRGRLMSGVDPSEFTIYSEPKTAEMFLIDNLEHMRAVYSFASTASLSASLMGVPSYHIFRCFFNRDGIRVFDDMAEKARAGMNPYLRELSDFDEIGCIDSVNVEIEEQGSWRESWLSFLK